MLERLHIRNYILIDSLDISFPEGLVIVTGQTGAGKSILIGALSLLAGAKADAGMISEGADNCVVEAEFTVEEDETLREIVDDNDIEWDGGRLIIRRVINSSGRSRSFVNDSPVQVQLLSTLASRLIDIHSQHQSLLLTDSRFQLSILDHYAGCTEKLAECAQSWKELQALRSEKAALSERLGRINAEKAYSEAQFKQLDEAKLREGELEELEEEQRQLANAEEIKEAFARFSSLVRSEDESGVDIPSALKEAQRCLERVSRYVPAAQGLAGRVDSARIELEDIASDVERLDSGISLDQNRLMAVEERMSMLYSLLSKHGCEDIAGLIALRDKYSEELFDATASEERMAALDQEISRAEKKHLGICKELGAKRREAAPAFAKDITGSLHFLELDRATFSVSLEEAAPGPSGADAVKFMFSASGGQQVEVAKCASGGELSRIMLCLKAMMARFIGMPTMIFDEIDTGVSGSVADKMGSMICSMGENMQIFSITHLPQVAAKGDAHYLVTKEYSDGRAVTGIRRLSGEERVMEVARMLSGSSVTPEAVANARSLLK